MKVGSLFSGGGLGDFGFMAAGMEIAWQCEIDEYCQKILALRYPESTKYRDIKTLKGTDLEPIDILTGGFPCQPFSVAGKQKGKEDNRYLWPEMLRVIRECRPRWIVGENVPGIINMALDTVCSDLEAEGYEVWPIVFPSHALGAWHKRDRLWLIAYSEYAGRATTKESGKDCSAQPEGAAGQELFITEPSGDCGLRKENSGREIICHSKSDRTQGGIFESRSSGDESIKSSEDVADTKEQRLERRENGRNTEAKFSRLGEGCRTIQEYWQSEPSVGRVANGVADRVHRLKMLGNGQVPACTYVIGKMIMEIERHLTTQGK